MFGCVLGTGTGGWSMDPQAGLSYQLAYMSELLYPAVIPLAGTLPPGQHPGRIPSSHTPKSRDLKFGIDRILSPKSQSKEKEGSPKSGRTSEDGRTSPWCVSQTSAALASTSSLRAEGPGAIFPRQNGELDLRKCQNVTVAQQKYHEIRQDLRQEFRPEFTQLRHPELSPELTHPKHHELGVRLQQLPGHLRAHGLRVGSLRQQELGSHCPCLPAAAAPSSSLIFQHHPSLHPVHIPDLHIHRHEHEGSYAVLCTEPQRPGQQSQPKRKRSWSRAVFSHLQRKGLEKRFEVQKYVTKPDRKQLAAMLGLTDAQVKVWFQNRRMKWRHAEEAKRTKQGSDTADTAVTSDANNDVTTVSAADCDISVTSECDVTITSSNADHSEDEQLCIDDEDETSHSSL